MEKPDDLARLERIFDEVCERTPSERAAYLDDACPDPGDRRRIEWMLDRFDRALEAGESAPKIIQGPSTPPEEVAGFRVVRELGRGGMGVVYLAEQSEPVRRKVALKIARTNLRGRQAIERFHVERQALARLSHPNVAQLFEAGATEDDFPYFAMEYVQGREIVEHCDSEQLDIGARLRLFVDVCSGVHHAHLNGVLHRDLKPSNLLVGEYDGRAVPKVIDFGVAKAIDASWSDGDLSRTGIVGTPAYLSPEAIDVSRSVDGRTDVYSLAVVLCELVAGTRAVAQKESPYEVVTPSTPRSASKVFAESDETTRARVARQRGLTPARLARLLEGDLGWIVARATAPAPEERYASVDALAADVQRFLDDRPVEAAPHDRIQVARKFARRHRTSLVAGALVVLATVAGISGLTIGLVRAQEAERVARSEAARADEEAASALAAEKRALAEARRAQSESEATKSIASFLTGLFQAADPAAFPGEEVTARALLDDAANQLRDGTDERPLVRAKLMETIGTTYRALGLLDPSREMLEASRAILADVSADFTDRVETELQLGEVARTQGRLDDARATLDALLVEAYERAPSDSLLLARILEALSAVEIGAANYDVAEQQLGEALDLLESADDVPAASIANVLQKLAICTAQSDPSAALEYFERVLEVHESELDPESPAIGRALLNLAMTHSRTGHPDEAVPLLRRAIEVLEASLGDEHADVGSAYLALAEALLDFEEAEPFYETGLLIQEKAIPESTVLAGNYIASANRFVREQRYDAAIEFLTGARSIYALGGRVHPNTGKVEESLAVACSLAERDEEAEEHFEAAIAAYERTLGQGHPQLGIAYGNAGEHYLSRGKVDEARSYLRRGIAILEAALGADHAQTSAFRESLERVLDEPREGD